jgi:hypothetical protein
VGRGNARQQLLPVVEVTVAVDAEKKIEIGRILHFKSEIGNLKLDRCNLRFPISDLKCRIRPISNFFLVHDPHLHFPSWLTIIKTLCL